MDYLKKVNKLRKIVEDIKQKQKQIQDAQIELNKLKEQYEIENNSQLPILLFVIDQTLPMPDDECDLEYQYIYYFPDLDVIKCLIKNKENDFLPNTIDLREQFVNFGVPQKEWIGNCYYKYYDVIMKAVFFLKANINEIFNSNDINSWVELGIILTNEFKINDYSKVLKK